MGKFVLDSQEMAMLNFMLREPAVLQQVHNVKPYQATDNEACYQLLSLIRWLEHRVMTATAGCPKCEKPTVCNPKMNFWVCAECGAEHTAPDLSYKFSVKECSLPERGIKRLLDVMEHYKVVGQSMPWMKLYISLQAKLSKKSIVLDDFLEE